MSEADYDARLGSLLGIIERLGGMLTAELLTIKDQGGKASALVELYKKVRDATDGIEESAKTLISLKQELKDKLIPEAFDREQLSTLTTQAGDRVTVSNRVVASIPAEFREKAYQWLRDQGHGDLIIETVNSSTLASFARTRLEETGEDLPEDLFKVAIIPSASLTKARNGKSNGNKSATRR